VQHESKRRENVGKWALPGGRLKVREEPKSGLRRELYEELAIWVPKLTPLGEWIRVGECQRVYGCEIDDVSPSPQPDEIAAVAWLEYDDVVRLATERRLRWGFELAAINVFQRLAR
jgi:8-oxo-dGTP pyrophosphatase MutT (NUDIX family)